MKKFSFLSSVFLLAVVLVFLIMGCQKESAAADENIVPAESSAIKAIAGDGSLPGAISTAYAAALQRNFIDKYGDDNQTYQVAFSAKDLSAFISNLQAKYKSDIIYVNFGLYGKGAPGLKWSDNGRLTVFFTGNNIRGNSSGTIKTDGSPDESSSSDTYLNHGGLVP